MIIRNTYGRNKCSILVYHDPDANTFKGHVKYLSKRYTFTTLDKLAEAIRRKDPKLIPRKALIITIDDGHKNNYKLLRVLTPGVIPVIYACSQIIGTMRHFWFKEASHHGMIVNDLKGLSNKDRLRELGKIGFHPRKEYANNRHALNLEELTQMKEVVSFQSHTRFHPILTSCDDEEAMEEIATSKTEMEKYLNVGCEHFSYPNGDYTEREIGFVTKAGYKTARTIHVGWNDVTTNPYELKIVGGLNDKASINNLAAVSSGLVGWLVYAMRLNFNGRYKIRKLNIPTVDNNRQGSDFT